MSLFLAVSRFVRDKHIQAGFVPERIHVKPNFVWEGPGDEDPATTSCSSAASQPRRGSTGSSTRGVPARLSADS